MKADVDDEMLSSFGAASRGCGGRVTRQACRKPQLFLRVTMRVLRDPEKGRRRMNEVCLVADDAESSA